MSNHTTLEKSWLTKWVILAIVSSALFLIVVDMTVLFTALPALTTALDADASEKLWIVNIYSLVCAGTLLGMGTLGDRFGHRKIFIWGLLVFGSSSLAAAHSNTPTLLIAARAFLALGAAMMMPATLSIIRLTFKDEREQSLAIGVWAAVASGGLAIGPLIGGILLEHFWWGSVFLINLPVVIIATLLSILMVPASEPRPDQKWDLTSSVLAMASLIGLAYAIKEIAKVSPSTFAAVAAFSIGLSCALLFVRRQRVLVEPMLDFKIFRSAGFTIAVIAAVTSAAIMMTMQLLFTQRLQLALGMSPLEAGLYLLPLSLPAFISGPLTGFFLPTLGAKRTLGISFLIAGVGLALYLVAHHLSILHQLAALTLVGFGIGASVTAASSTIMQSAPPERAGMAASIEEVSYELGGAMGVAIMGSLLFKIYSVVMVIPPRVLASPRAYESLDDAIVASKALPSDQADLVITAALDAFDWAFLVVLATCAILLLVAGWVMGFTQFGSSTVTFEKVETQAERQAGQS